MSIRTLHYLYCDGDNCPLNGKPLDATPNRYFTITSTRHDAKMCHGWVEVKGRDYCFDCNPRKHHKENNDAKCD